MAQIVQKMIELNGDNFIQMMEFIAQETEDQFAQRYAALLRSLIDPLLVHYFNDIQQSTMIKTCQVNP